MNKTVIPSILTATILVAGIFAFMPVEKASTVHTSIGTQQVEVVRKTLPSDGTDVLVTITAATDTVIHAVWIDNTPSAGTETDHELNSMTVGGSSFKDGIMPNSIAGSDAKETRDLLGILADDANGQDFIIPLNSGQTVILNFDTENGADDVIIDVIIAGRGSFTIV